MCVSACESARVALAGLVSADGGLINVFGIAANKLQLRIQTSEGRTGAVAAAALGAD